MDKFERYDNDPIYRAAYDYAYRVSNDWAIENPTWNDVIKAFEGGAKIKGIGKKRKRTKVR